MKSESEISSRLKALREKSGLSVRKTAAAINMTATTYQYYEQGFKKPHLPRELALALADVFSEHGVRRKFLRLRVSRSRLPTLRLQMIGSERRSRNS